VLHVEFVGAHDSTNLALLGEANVFLLRRVSAAIACQLFAGLLEGALAAAMTTTSLPLH